MMTRGWIRKRLMNVMRKTCQICMGGAVRVYHLLPLVFTARAPVALLGTRHWLAHARFGFKESAIRALVYFRSTSGNRRLPGVISPFFFARFPVFDFLEPVFAVPPLPYCALIGRTGRIKRRSHLRGAYNGCRCRRCESFSRRCTTLRAARFPNREHPFLRYRSAPPRH